MAEGKPYPRWVRALGLVLLPIKVLGSVGRLVLVLLAIAAGGAVVAWKEAFLVWARADPYHIALVVAGLLAVSGYAAVYALLGERDKLLAVSVSVRVVGAEWRDDFRTMKLDPSPQCFGFVVSYDQSEVRLRDVLVVRFKVSFCNDGPTATKTSFTQLSLLRRRYRYIGWVAVPFLQQDVVVDLGDFEGPASKDRWHPERRFPLPACDEVDVGLTLVATLMDDEPKVVLGQPLRARLVVKIYGQPEQTLEVALPPLSKTHPPPTL